MKINRLIEITVLLLNRRMIKAKDLAERFEVSTRTIYRDVEILSMSGIPVYMSKGKGGGISLLENYSINKTFLSKEDKESLVVALKTLQSTKYPEVDTAIEKIRSLVEEELIEDWVQVDFSQWGSNPNEHHKFIRIKEGILQRNVLSFTYMSSQGYKTNRTVEPMKLIYKGQAWYLYGYCREKAAYRVFRISRIKGLILNNEKFERKKDEGDPQIQYEGELNNIVNLKLRFSSNMLHRVYDDFDDNQIIKYSDGSCEVTISFPEDEWVYGYILSFGNWVEVIEPKRIREIILSRMKEAIKKYDNDDL